MLLTLLLITILLSFTFTLILEKLFLRDWKDLSIIKYFNMMILVKLIFIMLAQSLITLEMKLLG